MKKKNAQSKRFITKDAIVGILVLSIAVMNLLALLFALVDVKQEFLSDTDRFFANGFTVIFGDTPVVIESYETLLTFFCLCHFTVAVIVIAMLAVRLAVRKKLNFGKMGMSAVVLSAIFTTVYFILGCVAFSEATAYGGEGYGYSAHTFAFIPFALMIILVGAFILVKVKLPKNYKIVLKKRNK